MGEFFNLFFAQACPVGCPVKAEVAQAVNRVFLVPPRLECRLKIFPSCGVFLEAPVYILFVRVILAVIFKDISEHCAEEVSVRACARGKPHIRSSSRVGVTWVNDYHLTSIFYFCSHCSPVFIEYPCCDKGVPAVIDNQF